MYFILPRTGIVIVVWISWYRVFKKRFYSTLFIGFKKICLFIAY